MTLDWGIGNYEQTARELEPAASHLADLACLEHGERLLDIGCGTGNAALLAAGAGADVIGLDPAPRLISVARSRAVAARLEATFVAGDAQRLPFGDRSFDVVVSVFGIVFAANPERAFAEMIRVLRPGGRALISAWLPDGAIRAMIAVMNRAFADATREQPTRFEWHEPEVIRGLARRHRAVVDFHDGQIGSVGASAEDYFAQAESNHPISVAAKPLLERTGSYAAARAQAISLLRAGNEDPDRFRVTSRYRVSELRVAA